MVRYLAFLTHYTHPTHSTSSNQPPHTFRTGVPPFVLLKSLLSCDLLPGTLWTPQPPTSGQDTPSLCPASSGHAPATWLPVQFIASPSLTKVTLHNKMNLLVLPPSAPRMPLSSCGWGNKRLLQREPLPLALRSTRRTLGMWLAGRGHGLRSMVGQSQRPGTCGSWVAAKDPVHTAP